MSALDRPEWQLPLSSDLTARPGPLRAALLTTFEPPDPDVLVEDLFPAWLGLGRELVDSGPGRTTFLVDLQQRLRALRGRVSIFSSAGSIRPHWLWRDVHVCQVGSGRKAIQHAKLWLLHRGPGLESDTSTLEIVVSSTNLTRPALQDQIQAGWRALITLEKAAAHRLASWGVLPGFLAELGLQSGRKGGAAVRYWLEYILPRAQCPNVEFVASVPGRHQGSTLRQARSAWGVAGLRQLRPIARTRRIELVAPSVGRFDLKALEQWAERAGTSLDRLALAWIPKGHLWGKRGWSMPVSTAKSLRKSGMTVKLFPDPESDRKGINKFHDEWDRTCDRWLHGKLCWIKDVHRRRLLVTSANWSQAAWGQPLPQGGLSIENFELGAAFDCAWTPLDGVGPLDGDMETQQALPRESEPTIAWTEGSWDGKLIRLAARLSGAGVRLLPSVEVACNGTPQKRTVRWRATGSKAFLAQLRWIASSGMPMTAVVRTRGEVSEKVEVIISDIRPRVAENQETIEGVDPGEADRLELRLLEERYGGPSADDPEPPESDLEDGGPATGDQLNGGRPPSSPGPDDNDIRPPANYEMSALVTSRKKLAIVTNWAEKLAAIAEDDRDGALPIIEDGRRLLALWRSQDHNKAGMAGLATRIALGELEARLKRCR